VAHLHIPDGLLPPVLWAPALAITLVLLVIGARVGRQREDGLDARRHVAWQGALGALMLAAMALEVPLGPIEYHLTLVGPVGVLLGPLAAFQVVFVVNAILALMGHGGLTVVGLNALVLGAGAAVARPAYALLARRATTAAALAGATALAQAVAGLLWLAVVGVALRSSAVAPERIGLVAGLAIPVWLAGIVAESVVAFGTGRFLARVRPDLLPRAGGAGAHPRPSGVTPGGSA
jgi:cobalt/nickel transport system permease protein